MKTTVGSPGSPSHFFLPRSRWRRGPRSAPSADAFDQVKRLGRGVNILGYDPIWKNPKKARFQEKHFQLIREAGFQTVRINLHALQRMGKAPIYKLPEAWLATLDWAVEKRPRRGPQRHPGPPQLQRCRQGPAGVQAAPHGLLEADRRAL